MEVVNTNSRVHNDPFESAAHQASFDSSTPSGSSDELLIWSEDISHLAASEDLADRFVPSPNDNLSFTSPSFYHEPRNPQALMSFMHQYAAPTRSVMANNHQFPQSIEAPFLHSTSGPNDDFIELDMWSRSTMLPSEEVEEHPSEWTYPVDAALTGNSCGAVADEDSSHDHSFVAADRLEWNQNSNHSTQIQTLRSDQNDELLRFRTLSSSTPLLNNVLSTRCPSQSPTIPHSPDQTGSGNSYIPPIPFSSPSTDHHSGSSSVAESLNNSLPSIYPFPLTFTTTSQCSQMSTTEQLCMSSTIKGDYMGTLRDGLSAQLTVVPVSQLATGSSLTCTVVNILRGLRLLDHCGLEDICTILYDLRRVSFNHVNTQSDLMNPTHFDYPHGHLSPISATSCGRETGGRMVVRSSSFTSSTMINHFTFMEDNLHRVDHCDPSGKRQLIKLRSLRSAGCIVRYVMECSYQGSGLLSPQLPCHHSCDRNILIPTSSDFLPSELRFAPLDLRTADWRRGRASSLVDLLTSNAYCNNVSPTVINRLLTGRFLRGPKSWYSVRPTRSTKLSDNLIADPSTELSAQLLVWLIDWIRHGAVIVLVQLDKQEQMDFSKRFESSTSHLSPSCDPVADSIPFELTWQHRVICGVTTDGNVQLSNPIQTVPVQYLLDQLSRKTALRMDEGCLARLWLDHRRQFDRPSVWSDMHDGTESIADCASPCWDHQFCGCSSCGEDLSLLAEQPDSRWQSWNILGQILSTLRNLESATIKGKQFNLPSIDRGINLPGPSFLNDKSNSDRIALCPSTIVIPSAQAPGFSLFVNRYDRDLVQALFDPLVCPPFIDELSS